MQVHQEAVSVPLPNTASSQYPQNFDRTFSQQQRLVGGFNPFEKYWKILVKIGIFPNRGEHQKNIWNHHVICCVYSLFFMFIPMSGNDPIWRIFISNGLVQPPRSNRCLGRSCHRNGFGNKLLLGGRLVWEPGEVGSVSLWNILDGSRKTGFLTSDGNNHALKNHHLNYMYHH